MASLPEEETLIEEKYAKMVSPCGGKPTYRTAHFLKPSFPTSKQPKPILNLPQTRPISSNLNKITSKIHFFGWRHLMKEWVSWVEKMRVKFEPIWRKAGMFEAIMVSKLEIPKCCGSLYALAERWCPETKSFVLPWGEVTVTLEDIMILGGFPVTGDSVLRGDFSFGMCEIVDQLYKSKLELNLSKSKKSSQKKWLEMWMDKGSEIEHEAFLSLWLSRYVFPADDVSVINKSVFIIAVRLAKGIKVALAPAVLACIYRDLRVLKEMSENLRDLSDEECESVKGLKLWAPLQLFQAWIWERFHDLSPKPNVITSGSRLERWNKVKVLRKDDIDSIVDSASSNFNWRPYTIPLNNWSFCAKLYPENAGWIRVSSDIDFDMESYVRFIRTSELVGLDEVVEQYLPYRVSMQFGLDQDIPSAFPQLKDAGEVGWNDYDRPLVDVKLYVPSKLFESDVSVEYSEWWKRSIVRQGSGDHVSDMVNVKPVFNPFQGSLKLSIALAVKQRIKIENNEADVPPGFVPKDNSAKLDAFCDSSSSKRSRGSPCHVGSGIKSYSADASSDFNPQVKEVPAVGGCNDPPNSKRSRGSPYDVGTETKSINDVGAFEHSPRVEGVQAEDDSDDDDLPLTQVFASKASKRASRSVTVPVLDLESPLSSAGDNYCMQEFNSVTDFGATSHAGSPVRSLMNNDKREAGASFRSDDSSSELDLLGRIARLQRIIDMVKLTKT